MTEENVIIGRIQQTMYTAAALTAANPVLLAKEIVYESDTNRYKVGDGTSPWNVLPYAGTNHILTPIQVPTASGFVLVGGNAYYYTGTAAVSVTGVDKFSDQKDYAMLTVPGNVAVTFGSGFKQMKDLATLSGTAAQYKTYTIQRVPSGPGTVIYEVNGNIYG